MGNPRCFEAHYCATLLPTSAKEKSLITKVGRKNYRYPAYPLWHEPPGDYRFPPENDAEEVKDRDHEKYDTCGERV